MKIRPSSLPALAQCARFESDPQGSDYTAEGTARHAALSKLLDMRPDALDDIPEDQRDGVLWAHDYIQLHAPMADHAIETEQRSTFIGPDFEEITGTPDVVCGPVVFDLKWRWRDYTAQMAAYALMNPHIDQGVRVHVLYAESQKAAVYEFTRDGAEEIVFEFIKRANDPSLKPTPCDYCGWCAKQMTCEARVFTVNKIVMGRDDWNLSTWHSSEIETPEDMGKALRIARAVAGWCESVEHHAKEMAIKRGILPEGFKIQSRQGNRFVASLLEAFPKSGMTQEQFLAACEVKLSKLVEAYANSNGMKKSAAERELEAKLGETVQRKSPSMSLVEEKGKE